MSTRLRTSLVALAVATTVAVPTAAAARASSPTPASGRTSAVAATTVGHVRAAVVSASTSRPAASRTSAAPAHPTPRVTIRRYVDAPGSQRQIDRCRLVLWTHRPMWLAGHNYCGYQWLASVRTGTTVVVASGRAAGRYVVTGHLRLARQSGPLPRVHADLVLQTCVGHGTGLTLARRVG